MTTALGIYALGFVAMVILLIVTTANEPTAHGQSILLGYGCLLVILWPLALAWCALIWIGLGLKWLLEKVGVLHGDGGA